MKFTLLFKFVIIATTILLFAVGANLLINNHIFVKEYSSAVQSEAFAIGQSLKFQLDRLLALGIPLEELVGFEKQCQDTVSKYKDISYAMVVNIESKILFHNDPSYHGKTITDSSLLRAVESTGSMIQLSPEKKYYDITIPVFSSHNQHIGAVIVGVPVEVITSKTNQMIQRSVLSMLIFFIIAAFVFYYLARNITSHLKELSKGAAAISKGDLDFELKVSSKDEIGELAQTFDEMRLGVKDRNDLLNSLLNTFKGKFGNIATILARKNVQKLVRENPRIHKILPKSIGSSIVRAKRIQKEVK